MINPVADSYNKIYSKDSAAYGTDPLPSVMLLAEHLKTGSILEIGAGTGRNSIYLASAGFHVTATDISSRGIEIITENAARAHVPIQTQLLDIGLHEPDGFYDGVLCTFVLQHLSTTHALEAITRIQAHTHVGGYNLICAFTQDGDFFRANPATDNFYLDNKKQLEQIYHGWNVIRLFERNGKARATNSDGSPQFNVFAGILAQKK